MVANERELLQATDLLFPSSLRCSSCGLHHPSGIFMSIDTEFNSDAKGIHLAIVQIHFFSKVQKSLKILVYVGHREEKESSYLLHCFFRCCKIIKIFFSGEQDIRALKSQGYIVENPWLDIQAAFLYITGEKSSLLNAFVTAFPQRRVPDAWLKQKNAKRPVFWKVCPLTKARMEYLCLDVSVVTDLFLWLSAKGCIDLGKQVVSSTFSVEKTYSKEKKKKNEKEKTLSAPFPRFVAPTPCSPNLKKFLYPSFMQKRFGEDKEMDESDEEEANEDVSQESFLYSCFPKEK